jgi:phosphatidylglycerophosphate synthase
MMLAVSHDSGGSSSNYSINLLSPSSWPAFALIIAVLLLFFVMYFYIRWRTSSKRALEGFIEATEIDVAFLGISIVALLYLAANYPSGNHVAWAVSQVILRGYWLAFAIPIVTVGNTIHGRTRGTLPWRGPSIAIAVALFAVIYYLTYSGG